MHTHAIVPEARQWRGEETGTAMRYSKKRIPQGNGQGGYGLWSGGSSLPSDAAQLQRYEWAEMRKLELDATFYQDKTYKRFFMITFQQNGRHKEQQNGLIFFLVTDHTCISHSSALSPPPPDRYLSNAVERIPYRTDF